jgi:hypothetical protein
VYFTLGVASRAVAEEPSQNDQLACVRAYEAAQEHRLASKLLASRQDLLTCREESCKAFISKACNDWLAEVNAALSTVTFDVWQGERAIAEVRVSDNGTALLNRVDGDPVELDPGEHLFELQIPGADPIQKRVVLQPAEKNRLVRVFFPVAKTIDEKPVSESPASPSSSPWPYIFGSVGGLGLSGFAVLGIWGISRENDLRDQCAPHCSHTGVLSVRRQYLAADISLGVGVLALSAGAYLWFSAPDKSAKATGGIWRLGVTSAPYGAFAHLQRSF